ncbi:unnamed protein product [Blepharisma stoltei]|uniref:TmcB/TmcC TPR repeats domain-containing protein n=1 Tax=Blepharisma stoltei TaxID=1481888 RepID=A0AAU9JE77_9CILI|nr:unnamed protein product [Blepharisma stoltei]
MSSLMAGLNADRWEVSNLKSQFLKLKRGKSLVKSLFEVYRQLYFKKGFADKSAYKQKVKAIFEAAIWCFQLVALVWIPNLPIKNWSGNIFIWEIIGYLRLDNTCAEFGILGECLYLAVFIAIFNFLGIFLLAYCIYNSFEIPTYALIIFKRTFYLWVTMLFIPSLTLFSIFEKYNFSPHNTVLEYRSNNSFKNFEINSAFQVAIVFVMIISFFLLLSYTEFSGEIRHFASSRTIKAKAHSRIDNHAAIFMYFLPIIYAMLAENHIIFYQILIMLASLALMIESMKFLPYFSIFYNSIVILRFFIIALISFIFLLGYWIDNSLSIILFAIVLLPILSIYFIYFIVKRQQGASISLPNNLIGIDTQYKLEKVLRQALCENDTKNKNQIIEIFELFFMTLNRSKLQVVWETNYFLYSLKDESLARVKLSKIKTVLDWNWEASYQAYLCQKNIEDSYMSESSTFLSFFQQLNWIKRKDRKLCKNLLKFWKEVTSKKPILKSLITKLKAIDDRILFLNNEYSQIITKFSNSRESLALYASYTRNILYDIEKAIMLDNKLRYFDRIAQSSTIDTKQLSFFDDKNGVLIFSNEEENFGEILFSNPAASKILKTPSNSIVGNNISNFIPPYYRKIFIDETQWFTHFGSNSEINLDDGFFIYLPTNFILECTGKASITAFNNCIITAIAFKVKQTRRYIALISENWDILCHSEDFSKFSVNNQSNLAGFALSNILNIEIANLNPFVPYNLAGLEKNIILLLAYFEFHKIKIPYILLTDDLEEIEKWKDKGLNENYSDNNYSNLSDIKEKTIENLEIPLKLPTASAVQESKENNYDSDFKLTINKADDNLDISSNLSSEKMDEKSLLSQHTSLKRFINITKIFSRALNILHLIFVLSILIVIATNIAVLFYAFSSISLVSDISISLTIGNLGKNLQYAAYLAKSVLVLCYGGADMRQYALSTMVGFGNTLIELENIHSYVTSNLTNWDSCSGRDYFTDQNIDLWNVKYSVYREKTNLLDALTKFIHTVKVI